MDEFRPSPELQERIEYLATKCTEDELTPDERTEYEHYVRLNSLMAVLHRRKRCEMGGDKAE